MAYIQFKQQRIRYFLWYIIGLASFSSVVIKKVHALIKYHRSSGVVKFDAD